ncbi:MAG TPA: hypothetical protein VJQ84_01185, partial [Solirubrobacterales bacterium]|nr:hypothetical protein [Solirubrobacterales bacterium]
MIRRKLVRLSLFGPALALFALAGLSAVLSTSAAADSGGASLVAWGWWTQTNSSVTGVCAPAPAPCSVTNPVDPGNIHVQVGSNVTPVADQGSVPCPNGMPVNAGPVQCQNIYPVAATEVSAVRYKLATPIPFGTDSSRPIANLKLTVAGAPPAPGVQLLACRSDLEWQPAEGGAWSQRAAYNPSGCSTGAEGTDSAGNTVYQFAITFGEMATSNMIDVAIAPPNVPNMTPWNLELSPPQTADLTLYPPPPSQFSFSIPQAPAGLLAPTAPLGSGPASAFSGAPAPVATQTKGPAAPLVPAARPLAAPLAGLTGGRLVAVILLLAAL